MSDILAQLRDACATVAQRAGYVRINAEAIPEYAASLAQAPPPAEAADEEPPTDPAFWFALDAINFGSGWFPTLNKRPGTTGYRTIEAGLRQHGPWNAEELQHMTPQEIATALSQDPDHELMHLFAESLNDLGHHIANEYGGRFEAAVGHSATELVERLATWKSFADVSNYGQLKIPFLKRAQIAAADLARAKAADFADLDRLTMFADNLVPQVLRLDGILTFDPALVKRIDAEQLIEHGSREEVEIRACAVHAVELIVSEQPGMTAADTDQLLWQRGQEPRYKAVPRHRSRSTAY